MNGNSGCTFTMQSICNGRKRWNETKRSIQFYSICYICALNFLLSLLLHLLRFFLFVASSPFVQGGDAGALMMMMMTAHTGKMSDLSLSVSVTIRGGDTWSDNHNCPPPPPSCPAHYIALLSSSRLVINDKDGTVNCVKGHKNRFKVILNDDENKVYCHWFARTSSWRIIEHWT